MPHCSPFFRMMTSFQLHKERKKERKGLFREGQSRLSRTKMQVCLHPGRGPPTNVPPSGPDRASDASLVHPRHPAASSDKPFRLFLHPLICLSLNVPRTFYSKIQQQHFSFSRTQVTVIIRVLFKLFVTIEVFVDKVHLWAWFVLHY